jgi:hypothetical protein
MPGFFKAAAMVMSGGAIIGTGVLAVLPEDSEVAELPVLSCQQQFWLNADRACQTWTVAHREVERTLWANANAVENTAATGTMTVAERSPAKIADVALAHPRGTADHRARAAGRIPAASAPADGTRRMITRSTLRPDFPG